VRSAPEQEEKLRLGVSSCLLGQKVRYDGQHKRDAFLADRLAAYVELVPVCPEVELGLGVPRETIRLERRGGTGDPDRDVRLVAPRSGRDLTDDMRRWSERRVAAIAKLDLDGYVLKKDSPSCGMERVKVWGGRGQATKDGKGIFAAVLLEKLPLLPVEEEGRLHDDALREGFVERIFGYRRVKELFRGRWTVGDLVAFHAREKMLLLAHDPEGYRKLGPLVAAAKGAPRAEVARAYTEGFQAALRKLATRGKHTNALQHMAGFFKDRLPQAERDELGGAIGDYRRGLVPLVVPLTLLGHHVRRERVEWLMGQTYLAPSPKELMLRNHV
jgi:uncharacterized protein YbbK (DUF523 family)/uncharacterized protein YbgA (DUF1722 family)